MDAQNTLGLVVNSNRYFDYVVKLADAAMSKGKRVCIHLVGSGTDFVNTEAFARLSRVARISLCAASVQGPASREVERVRGRIRVVPPQELTRILKGCYRYVVF